MEFHYEETVQLPKQKIIEKATELVDYISYIKSTVFTDPYKYDEAPLYLPFDDEYVLKTIDKTKQYITPEIQYIIHIGIGGSYLGTKALYDAFYGYFDQVQPERYPKIIFLDTNDPSFVHDVQKFVTQFVSQPEKLLLIAVTKSGSTTETIVNLEALAEVLPFDVIRDRLVIVTKESTKLHEQAHDYGIVTLELPEKIGGRYSALSAVSFPSLLAMGIDIHKLIDGAQVMQNVCLLTDIEHNPAALSAAILFLLQSQGCVINDTFIFHPELESLGKWYRQLMAESIGKEKDLNGNTIHAGITPTVSIGSLDLHSTAQLYLGGPQNRSTTFVTSAQSHKEEVTLHHNLVFPDIVEEIEDKSTSEIMWAIYEGVKATYRNHQLPFTEIVLKDISPHELGQFMQFKMSEMMFLGKLLNVNAFDQPNVEAYKQETKRILGSQ